MLMSMLTGAHAELVPYITALHNAEPTHSDEIAARAVKLFQYKTQNWVKDMINELVVDFFQTLPDETMMGVARKLAAHPSLPLYVCLQLMDRSKEMAELLLEDALILSEQDLIYRANMFKDYELAAIARRRDITEKAIQMLVKSGEPVVYLELLRNPSLQSKPELMDYLVAMARRSPTAAWYVVNQPLRTPARQVGASAG